MLDIIDIIDIRYNENIMIINGKNPNTRLSS